MKTGNLKRRREMSPFASSQTVAGTLSEQLILRKTNASGSASLMCEISSLFRPENSLRCIRIEWRERLNGKRFLGLRRTILAVIPVNLLIAGNLTITGLMAAKFYVRKSVRGASP